MNTSAATPPGDNLVDERWDLGFFHPTEEKQQPIEHLIQNLSITPNDNKVASPPLTDDKSLLTAYFAEEFDEDDNDYGEETVGDDNEYFYEPSLPVITIDTATPIDTPPASAPIEEGYYDFLHEEQISVPQAVKKSQEEEVDLSITSVNDLPPNESIQFSLEETEVATVKELVSLDQYNAELVQHYIYKILDLTHDSSTVSKLPDMYQQYLAEIQNSY